MEVSFVNHIPDDGNILIVECTCQEFPKGYPDEELKMMAKKELKKLLDKIRMQDLSLLQKDDTLLIICFDSTDITIEGWEVIVEELKEKSTLWCHREIFICSKSETTKSLTMRKFIENNPIYTSFKHNLKNARPFEYDDDVKDFMVKKLLSELYVSHKLTEDQLEDLLAKCNNLEEVFQELGRVPSNS